MFGQGLSTLRRLQSWLLMAPVRGQSSPSSLSCMLAELEKSMQALLVQILQIVQTRLLRSTTSFARGKVVESWFLSIALSRPGQNPTLQEFCPPNRIFGTTYWTSRAEGKLLWLLSFVQVNPGDYKLWLVEDSKTKDGGVFSAAYQLKHHFSTSG